MKELKVGLVFKKRIRVMAGAMLLAMVASFCYSNNPTSGYVGPGNDTSGTTTSCSSFINGYQYLCGNPAGKSGGGASWHVYNVNQLSLDKLHYVGSILDYGGVDANDVRKSCQKAGAGWAAVYGWEGSVSKGNGNILTGPAKRTGDIGIAQYNSYNAMNWTTLQTRILNDNIPDNRRITLDAAKRLYNAYTNKQLDSGVGYFCFNTERFQARAVVYNGSTNSTALPHSSTGFVTNKKQADILTIKCSDKTNGCPVHFSFDMKTVNSGNGKTWYKIFSKKIESSVLTAVTPKTGVTVGSTERIVFEKTVKLKPGQNICYAVYFGTNNLLPDKSGWARACARAVDDTVQTSKFEGRARVFNGTWFYSEPNSSTGYTDQQEVRGKTLDINCPYGEKCPVFFSLDLNKVSGSANNTWYIAYKKDTDKECSEGKVTCEVKRVASQPVASGGGTVFNVKENLSPGQTICYTIKFGTNGVSSSKDYASPYGWTKICARALSQVDPELSIKVKNNTLNTEYSNLVYAKPGDEISYKSTYKPLTQYAQSWVPGRMRVHIGNNIVRECDEDFDEWCADTNTGQDTLIDGENTSDEVFGENGEDGELEVNTGDDPGYYDDDVDWNIGDINVKNVGYKNLRELFNSERGNLPEWNNAYVVKGISSENCTSPYASETHKYEVGDTTEKVEPDKNTTTVLSADVGCSLGKMAEINPNSKAGNIDANIWTTPSRVEANVGDTNEASTADVYTERIFDTAEVLIPYNFTNTVSMDEARDVYAGEDVGIGYKVQVNPRWNDETKGNYATIVRNAKIQVVACEGEGCTSNESLEPLKEEFIEKLNSEGNMNGYTDSTSRTVTVPVPDALAGTTMCFRAKIYPASVKNDITIATEWDEEDSGYEWAKSEERCYKVAKRPSFQVWGGSIYSAKDVSIPLAVKKRLTDYNDGTYAFGSWAELGVVAGGKITGLASGAGLGYVSSDDAFKIRNKLNDSSISLGLGGGTSDNYCDMSTLSFANANCKNGVGGLGPFSVGSGDKSALVARFSDKNDDKYKLDDEHPGNYEILKIDDFSGELVGEGEEQKNKTTKVIKVGDTAIIKENITYKNDGYTSLEDIPKIIIYAKDIKINCNVTEIDAVLIADKGINDCVDDDGNTPKDNAKIRSKQLIIKGSVIADKLELNRTYGAATGVNSIVPAEIVNYDTSLYLWANQQSDVTKSGKLTEASTSELAPRY